MTADDAVDVRELRTRRSSYVVAMTTEGPVLVRWGATGGDDGTVDVALTKWETPADAAPLELAAAGTRQVRAAELLVQRPDGLDGARLRLVEGSVRCVEHDGGQELRATLREADTGDVEVDVHVRTSAAHDVVERWAEVRATGTATLHLVRAFGAGWNVPVGPGARVGALVGAWSRETTPVLVDLPAGQYSLGSRQGVTSHTSTPVLMLSRRTAADVRDPPGGTAGYGVSLAWSGSWRMAVDAVPFRDVVRVHGGADDETGTVVLEPGESHETPHSLGVWSDDGIDGVMRAWHEHQRTALLRTLGPEHRPVVYNSWYATGFDVRLEQQLALADVAAEVGAEVFVVDDGWFRGRTSDRAGLGDWTADPAAFPDGLAPLADAVLARGMRFGLWVEPECVNADSDLFRAHPEWVYRAGARPVTELRHQLVLDLGRPEVEQWAADTLRRLLTELPVSYLKWDMNRPVTDGGRPGDPRGREWAAQHARAYHRLLGVLRLEFPQVTVEACASGGGRVDAAVLAACDVVWLSDETGPRDRLAVQHGFLSAWTPAVMSSWVTDEPDRLDTAPTSLEFRFVTAMAGVLGIGSDLLAWDPPTRARARRLVDLYRSVRDLVHTGTVARHRTPADPVSAVQYTDASSGRALLLVWARPGAGGDGTRVPLVGLDPAARYEVRETGERLSGASAAVDGVVVPFALADDCDVLVVERQEVPDR